MLGAATTLALADADNVASEVEAAAGALVAAHTQTFSTLQVHCHLRGGVLRLHRLAQYRGGNAGSGPFAARRTLS
jgi:hypothetical protein